MAVRSRLARFGGAALVAGMTALAAIATPVPAPAAEAPAADRQYIPHLVYRTGPYAHNGIPFADGVADYYTLINERDGGINGVKIAVEECDFGYNAERAVKCYEEVKAKGAPAGPAAINPLSTAVAYALAERLAADRIPLLSSGYGRADAGDGRVFPYIFTLPASYWTATDAILTYIMGELGGPEGLKGKTIAFVYHDSPFGREPLPMLEKLKAMFGFDLVTFPVAPPGLEQRPIWLRIGRQIRPAYTILWGWGVQNPIAIREAAAVGYPMDRLVGVWWAGSEQDVAPAGNAARGYKAIAFHAPGRDYGVIGDIATHVRAKGKASGDGSHMGTVLYNRGVFNAAVLVEAIRTAQARFGNKPLTGEQVQWGFENLDLSADALAKLGLDGFMQPFRISCADHEGMTPLRIQRWDGHQWSFVSDWIEPRRDLIRSMVEDSAARYAAEQKITPRACP